MKLHEYWPQLLQLIDREQFFDDIADINEIAERQPTVESHLLWTIILKKPLRRSATNGK